MNWRGNLHAQYLNATYDFTDILEKYWLNDSYLVSLNSLLQIGSDRIQGKAWAPRNSKDLPRARKKKKTCQAKIIIIGSHASCVMPVSTICGCTVTCAHSTHLK